MLDLDTIGYYLFMQEQERQIAEKRQEPPPISAARADFLHDKARASCKEK